MIYAVLYLADGTPDRIMEGTVAQLNVNARDGAVWKVVDRSVTRTQDAPEFSSLPMHPEFEAHS